MKQIPDIDVIDLENTTRKPKSYTKDDKFDNAASNDDAAHEGDPYEADTYEANSHETDSYETDPYEEDLIEEDLLEEEDAEEISRMKGFRLNIHIVLIAVAVIFIGCIAFRIFNYGTFVEADDFKNTADERTYDDSNDQFMRLYDSDGNVVPIDTSDGLTILALGNSPYADDRDDENSLLNLIAKETGATIYNCSITGSYMAAKNFVFDSNTDPMDAYTPYWLTWLASGASMVGMYYNTEVALGDDMPVDAAESVKMLENIDLSTIDVVTFMYDATDYYLGHEMYDYDNTTDITMAAGNLQAAVELLQNSNPEIHIIIMGPTYAYVVDDDGNYLSSDQVKFGQDVLSIYSYAEWSAAYDCSVTYVDNIYGTITEDNASEYLSDHLHLNQKGRELVAARFIDALDYFTYSE